MKVWTLTLWEKLCGTTSTVCTGYGQWHPQRTTTFKVGFCLCCVTNFLSLYLCSYDDYDYGSVNVLLERSLKVFVKTMACHPEQTTAHIYHAFWRHFRHSEKVWMSSNTHLTQPLQPQRMNHLTFQHVVFFGTFSSKNEYLTFQRVLSFFRSGLESVSPSNLKVMTCLFLSFFFFCRFMQT